METQFKGNGSKPFKQFVDESSLMMCALERSNFLLPYNYFGTPPEIKILESEDGSILEIDLKDAIMFDPTKVVARLKVGTANFVEMKASQFSAEVIDGKLVATLISLV